jgi:alkylhydroperoxidase family enzyme
MARIPYPDIAGDPEIAKLAEQITRERGGKMLNLYRMLLTSPPLARGWLAMFTAIRQQLNLPHRDRELAILRVAVLNGADYEFAAHIPYAKKEGGLTDAQIDAVKTDPASPVLTPRDRAVLAYADAMTRQIRVPDKLFGMVRALFPERELVELTATIAGYNLVSRFLEALQIDHD